MKSSKFSTALYILLLGTLISLSFLTGSTSPVSSGRVSNPTVLYFFYGDGCPHCAVQKEFLEELQEEFPELVIEEYEIYNDQENREKLQQLAAAHGLFRTAVPATFIGDKHWIGFRDSLGSEMEAAVSECLETGCRDAVELIQEANPDAPPQLENFAVPFDNISELDRLVEHLSSGRLVLLGEASHGTAEYYAWRARITRELITQHDYDFVVVEGDWASLHQLNMFVKNSPEAVTDTEELFSGLDRWPPWMWSNQVVLDFVSWLREYNMRGTDVGFYGLDVYGTWEAGDQLVELLADVPQYQQRVADSYSCFEEFRDSGHSYARNFQETGESCEQQMENLYQLVFEEIAPRLSDDISLRIRQKASSLKYAERHYRAIVEQALNNWNERVYHMENTIHRLLEHYGPDARGIVWAHNTHVGDARATIMAEQGQVNMGQLMRQEYGMENVRILGFAGFEGTVKAGSGWGRPGQVMQLPQAVRNSHEEFLNRLDIPRFYMLFNDNFRQSGLLGDPRGHRAVGVVYNPTQDRGNYVPTAIPLRYDSLIFLRETSALEGLGLAN